MLSELYRPSLALLTDLYQLTMAQAYWKSGLEGHEAAFHLHFRSNPFGGGYAVAAGLGPAIEFLAGFGFTQVDSSYLEGVPGNDGRPLFEPEFLRFLRGLRFRCDVDAAPEGTVVFPPEPLLRVTGPIIEAQLVETALVNILNFQTLIATKAARVRSAASDDFVIEFGLRRAQGLDGGLSASRAAYVGGCDATSNVLAGRLFGIPVRGTHAHSWVMFFGDDATAFERYARSIPNNCMFLVDTYDSLEGVRTAIDVARRLRERGHEMVGIRLDSGDLAWLSITARAMLDEAGFSEARILASNELDEEIITSLKQQGARIDAWGVGTRLVTGGDQSALGAVYKLSAVREPGGPWRERLKLSEQLVKLSYPGVLQVRRFEMDEQLVADAIYDDRHGIAEPCVIVDPLDLTRRKTIPSGTPWADVLVPVMRRGRVVYDSPTLDASRRRTLAQLERLHPGIRRFVHPHEYPVGLEQGLHDLRTRLTLATRQGRHPS